MEIQNIEQVANQQILISFIVLTRDGKLEDTITVINTDVHLGLATS